MNTIKITWNELECIENGWAIEESALDDSKFDWKYKEVERVKHHRHNMELVTFVFFKDEKWWLGSYWYDENNGVGDEVQYNGIECFEAEFYEVTVTKWKKKENK